MLGKALALGLLGVGICTLPAQEAVPEPTPMAAPAPSGTDYTLSRIDQIVRMSRRLAGRRLPVRVQGVVTFSNPLTGELYLQSGADGISLYHPDPDLPLVPGTLIEVEGDTDAGRFAPKIIADPRSLKILGRTALPPAVPLTRELVLNMQHDCRRVAADGFGRRVLWENGELELQLDAAAGRVRVFIPMPERPPALPQHWIGAGLRVTGVVGTDLTPDGRMSGLRLYVSGADEVSVVSANLGAEFLPAKSLNDLLTFDPNSRHNGRVRTRGIVTLQRGDGSFFVQDGSVGVHVIPSYAVVVVPGEDVGFTAFPVVADTMSRSEDAIGIARCEDAVLLSRDRGTPPEPLAVDTHRQMRAAEGNGRLVRVRGEFLETGERDKEVIVFLRHDHGLFEGRMRREHWAQLPTLERGSIVELVGVKVAVQSTLLVEPLPVVLLRNQDDLRLIAPPDFWTPMRALSVAGVCAAGLLAVLFWSRARQRRLAAERDRLEGRVKERTKELTLMNESLQELAREKAEFLAIAAHDLRSPLTVITGYASILEMGSERPEATRQVASDIGSAAMRMERIIEHFLDAQAAQAGLHTPALVPTDLTELARKAGDITGPTRKRKQQTLTLGLPDEPCWALADRVLLDQIVANLLDNASKFSPKGRQITLRVQDLPDERLVRLTVGDEGPGISPDDQQRLFQRYTRLSARPTDGEPSCGLGLALVKAWVEMMDGKIGCRSELGRGAEFYVELPRAR